MICEYFSSSHDCIDDLRECYNCVYRADCIFGNYDSLGCPSSHPYFSCSDICLDDDEFYYLNLISSEDVPF